LARIKSPGLLESEGLLLQLLTKRELARRNVERDRKLADEGIIAKRRLQESEAILSEYTALADASSMSLRLAGLPDGLLRELIDHRTLHSTLDVVAPLDGVVLEQKAIAGQRVEAAAPLYRIGLLKPLWLEIHVPLARASTALVGGRVHLPDQAVFGRIIAIGREVHREDQGVLLRGIVEEGAEKLRPRQFVQVQILELGGETPAYRVASAAVVRDGAEAFLFMAHEGGFITHLVQVLDEQGDEVVVTSHFDPGELGRVVVVGAVALKAALLGEGQDDAAAHGEHGAP
jgi:multidrug efflux pump subunit AcrA (membrane-fusion protein)